MSLNSGSKCFKTGIYVLNLCKWEHRSCCNERWRRSFRPTSVAKCKSLRTACTTLCIWNSFYDLQFAWEFSGLKQTENDTAINELLWEVWPKTCVVSLTIFVIEKDWFYFMFLTWIFCQNASILSSYMETVSFSTVTAESKPQIPCWRKVGVEEGSNNENLEK